MKPSYVIGLDFGTDAVRAIVVDAINGLEISHGVHTYTRWRQKKYCDVSRSQFRQHPLDYTEGIESSIKDALRVLPASVIENIRAIGVDTTGSTPAPVHQNGQPLALLPAFSDNPDAMFVLWKDHTAHKEAAEINDLAHKGPTDYTIYSGGDYSPEWFWSKILHITKNNALIRENAFTWVEQSDWIPALLTGNINPLTWKRNRCAAGHKAMWHPSFGGLPGEAFLEKLHPALALLKERLYKDTVESHIPAGIISPEWRKKLGLPKNVVISTGILDAHAGAVGANIEPYTMVKVTGTSTCDMLVVPASNDTLVKGICGQVIGSIVPGMLGLEAGQSAFGDLYNWFVQLLMYPFEAIDTPVNSQLRQSIEKKIFNQLNAHAALLPVKDDDVISLDWINGRRTPDVDLGLKAIISGLHLGSDAAHIYKSLVEATAFGSRAIMERFNEAGIPVKKIIAVGGISKKSAYVMQVLANILSCPIHIADTEQSCALGAAIYGAVAGGIYQSFEEAQKKMASKTTIQYVPMSDRQHVYDRNYEKYKLLGGQQYKSCF